MGETLKVYKIDLLKNFPNHNTSLIMNCRARYSGCNISEWRCAPENFHNNSMTWVDFTTHGNIITIASRAKQTFFFLIKEFKNKGKGTST